MTTVLKGESATVGVRFRQGIIHPEAPEWTLYDWDDRPMQQGTATQSGDKWNAEFTIPSNLNVPEGVQSVQLEFKVSDTRGREHTLSQEIQIVDVYDEHRPYGLLWWSGHTQISDTVIFDREPNEIRVRLQDGDATGATAPNVLGSQVIDDPVPIANTDRGYVYEIGLSNLVFPPTNNMGANYYPRQLVIEALYGTGMPDVVIKPVYLMSPLIASKVNTLKRYLDKGQFTDIDPNLQWSDEELVHYLIEGVSYINASPPVPSYWTVETTPRALDSLVSMAAAWIALNARYIAEGFSKFNFNSGTVNIDWDRTPTIEYKMSELKAALDEMLMPAKKQVVATEGPGAGPVRSVGSLGVSVGPMLNQSIRFGGYFRRGG